MVPVFLGPAMGAGFAPFPFNQLARLSDEPSRFTLLLTPFTVHRTPYTLYPTPYTLHPTPAPHTSTLHPTFYTLHPPPYNLNPNSNAGMRDAARAITFHYYYHIQLLPKSLLLLLVW